MSRRRDDFGAGYSAALIVLAVILVLSTHGSHDNSTVSWWDIAQFLFIMAIFASCVIDVHKYWQRRKDSPDRQVIINYRSKVERDKDWSRIKDSLKGILK